MDLSVIEAIRYYMSCDEASGSADFSFVFHHVDMLEDKSIETSQIQRGPEHFPEIRVNPDYIRKLAEDAGDVMVRWGTEVLKHNLWHLLCGHADQRFERLVKQFGDEVCQAAADLIVNNHVATNSSSVETWRRVGVPLVTAKSLGLNEDETLEYYIMQLAGGGSAGGGDSEGDSQEQQPGAGQPQEGEGQGQPQPGDGSGIPKKNWPSPIGKVNPNFSEVDVQDFIQRSQSSEKLRGDMPGDADEYIKQLFQAPQVDWDYYLKEKEGVHRGHITRIAKNKPSRRCDWHLGRRRIGVLNVAFVVDTSGSMSTEDLELVGPEIDGIMERGGAEIMLLHCDAGVAFMQKYEIGMDLGNFCGRAGTDFRPAFDKLSEEEWQPDFVVYFTDGIGIAPDESVFDTLWVLTDSGMTEEAFKSQVCNWGTICKLRDNDCPSAVA